jgi:hypothetical protein
MFERVLDVSPQFTRASIDAGRERVATVISRPIQRVALRPALRGGTIRAAAGRY